MNKDTLTAASSVRVGDVITQPSLRSLDYTAIGRVQSITTFPSGASVLILLDTYEPQYRSRWCVPANSALWVQQGGGS